MNEYDSDDFTEGEVNYQEIKGHMDSVLASFRDRANAYWTPGAIIRSEAELKNLLDSFLQDYEDIHFFNKHYKGLFLQEFRTNGNRVIPNSDLVYWSNNGQINTDLRDAKLAIDDLGRQLVFVD